MAAWSTGDLLALPADSCGSSLGSETGPGVTSRQFLNNWGQRDWPVVIRAVDRDLFGILVDDF